MIWVLMLPLFSPVGQRPNDAGTADAGHGVNDQQTVPNTPGPDSLDGNLTAALRKVEPVTIKPEPLKLSPGTPFSRRALVSRPAPIDGVVSWTLETREHRRPIISIAFSPDGELLATACGDGTIRIWNAKTHQLIRALVGHDNVASSIAWSPNGRTLASAGWDDTVRLWDQATGMPLWTRRHQGSDNFVLSVTWSPDGDQLASAGSAHTICVWDAQSGQQINTLKGHTGSANCVAWSRTNNILASCSDDGTIQLWDAGWDQPRNTFESKRGVVKTLAWSLDGNSLAAGHEDGTLLIWNSGQAKADAEQHAFSQKKGFTSPLVLKGHSGQIDAIAWSPDGQTLVTSGRDKTIRIWNAETGQPIRSHPIGPAFVHSLAFSPDGNTLASVDGSTGILFWRSDSWKRTGAIGGCGNGVVTLGWSPQGDRLVMGIQAGRFSVWDFRLGKHLHTFTDVAPHDDLAWSPDRKLVATVGGASSLYILDIEAGQIRQKLQGHTDRVHAVVWPDDGGTIATASADHTIRVWEFPACQTVAILTGHTDEVHALSLSPDGRTLASGSMDSTIRLWDTSTNEYIRSISTSAGVRKLAWSPDGRYLASGTINRKISIWNVETDEAVKTLENLNGYGTPERVLAWSPDGKTLAGGVQSLGYVTAALWNPDTWRRRLLVPVGPDYLDKIEAVAWSSGSQWLAVGGYNNTLIAEASTGKVLGRLLGLQEDSVVVSVSVNGHFRGASGTDDLLIYVVQTSQGQETLTPSEFTKKYGWQNDPEQARLVGAIDETNEKPR